MMLAITNTAAVKQNDTKDSSSKMKPLSALALPAVPVLQRSGKSKKAAFFDGQTAEDDNKRNIMNPTISAFQQKIINSTPHQYERSTMHRPFAIQKKIITPVKKPELKKSIPDSTGIIQRKYVHDETSMEITDEQYATLMGFIDDYDVDPFEDFKKGGEEQEQQVSALVKMNMALGGLNEYFNTQFSNKHEKFAWKYITAQDNKAKFNFFELLQECVKGEQCNNLLASRLRLCLSTFEHIPDDEDSE